MARTKQATPLRRDPSSEYISKSDKTGTPSRNSRGLGNSKSNGSTNGNLVEKVFEEIVPIPRKEAGPLQLILAAGGIYGSFLTWALLQERLTTTPYGSSESPELFKFPVFLNTIQSLFAALVGYAYLTYTTPSGTPTAPIFPNRRIVLYLLLTAITSSLASPFGYASLAHLDYITFVLAKSCKLLPVMFLHVTLFQKRYPLYKYLVVLSVTAGVAVFTLHAGSGRKSKKPSQASLNPDRNTAWGLLLLSVNLLFDGLTNTTQDHVFSTWRNYKGPQMQCANAVLSTVLTTAYLAMSPVLVHTGFGVYLGMEGAVGGRGEVVEALAFMGRHPGVWWDVVGFAICGAVGQVFIFYTLSTFSSLVLVTITVTRKMLTMILSVVCFGHRLGGTQWAGVGLVFSGIGAEAVVNRREKAAKEKAKAKPIEKEL